MAKHRCVLLAQVNGTMFHQANGPLLLKVCVTSQGFSGNPSKIPHLTNSRGHAVRNIYSYTRNLDIGHLYLLYSLWLKHSDCYDYLKQFKYACKEIIRNHKDMYHLFIKNCKNSFSFRIKYPRTRWLTINWELILLVPKISE